MPIIGMRDLARRTNEVVERIERTKKPALLTRRGKPVALIIPVDEDAFEDFVLSNAPEFVTAMTGADKALREGSTINWEDAEHEFLPREGAEEDAPG